jgi:hypothetical protein
LPGYILSRNKWHMNLPEEKRLQITSAFQLS